jgi:hypothetical protein
MSGEAYRVDVVNGAKVQSADSLLAIKLYDLLIDAAPGGTQLPLLCFPEHEDQLRTLRAIARLARALLRESPAEKDQIQAPPRRKGSGVVQLVPTGQPSRRLGIYRLASVPHQT